MQEAKVVAEIETKIAEKSINELRAEVKQYTKEVDDLREGTDDYNNSLEKLKKANDALKIANDSLRESLGGNTKVVNTLQQQYKQYRTELANLEYGTSEYASKLAQLSAVQSQITKRNIDVRNSTQNVSDVFRNITQTSAGLVGGFNALQGVMALAGSESETLNKTFVQLQAGMSIVNGLQGVSGLARSFPALTAAIRTTTLATSTFGKAIIATGIGAIVVLLGYLIANFDDLKKKIEEIFPAINELGVLFERFKEIASGVINVVITYITSMAKAIKNLLTLDFSGVIDEFKNAYDVIGNYEQGFTDQVIRNINSRQQAREQEARDTAATNAKQLRAHLDMVEAEYGSDIKYTEDARELYTEYFNFLISSYEVDSDEYNRALVQKLSYDREYNSRQQAQQDKINKEAQARRDANLKAEKEYNNSLEELSVQQNNARIEAIKNDRIRRIELYNLILLNNQELETLRQVYEDNTKSWDERNKALNEYTRLLNQVSQVQKQIDAIDMEAEKKTKQQEKQNELLRENIRLAQELTAERQLQDTISKQLDTFSEEEQITYFQSLKEENDLRISLLWELANNESESSEARQKAVKDYNAAVQESYNIQKKIADAEAQVTKKKEDAQRAYFNTTKSLLDSSSSLASENTAAYKALGIASATIGTYSGASQVLGDATLPFYAKLAALGTVLATGFEQVRQIKSVKIPNASDSTSSSGEIISTIPSFPELQQPVIETHNNMDAYEQEVYNQSRKVYVVESDIREVANKVAVTEKDAGF